MISNGHRTAHGQEWTKSVVQSVYVSCFKESININIYSRKRVLVKLKYRGKLQPIDFLFPTS